MMLNVNVYLILIFRLLQLKTKLFLKMNLLTIQSIWYKFSYAHEQVLAVSFHYVEATRLSIFIYCIVTWGKLDFYILHCSCIVDVCTYRITVSFQYVEAMRILNFISGIIT